MTFAEFIAKHRCVAPGRPEDVLNPDFDVLHAIELGRRHSGAETLDDIVDAARRESRSAGRRFLADQVRDMLSRLWALYQIASVLGCGFELQATDSRRKIGL